MKQSTKILIGVLGGAITAGAIYLFYSKLSKTQKEKVKPTIKNKEKPTDDPEQQKELEIMKKIIDESDVEIRHWTALKALEYFSLPKTPEYQNDQFIMGQVKACCEFIKTIIGRRAVYDYKYPIDQFLINFDKYIQNPEIQALLSPHIKAIELICNRVRPQSLQFPQCDIDLNSFGVCLYKAQEFYSDSKITLVPNQIKEKILSDRLLPRLKIELWEKFKMPTKEGLTVETLIQNIISNCYLDNLEYGKKINEIQKNHIEEINEKIIKGIKIPEYEDADKHPVDEFIAKVKEYPFKLQNAEILNA